MNNDPKIARASKLGRWRQSFYATPSDKGYRALWSVEDLINGTIKIVKDCHCADLVEAEKALKQYRDEWDRIRKEEDAKHSKYSTPPKPTDDCYPLIPGKSTQGYLERYFQAKVAYIKNQWPNLFKRLEDPTIPAGETKAFNNAYEQDYIAICGAPPSKEIGDKSDQNHIAAIARAYRNYRDRKHDNVNFMIDLELLLHWFDKGYSLMSEAQLAEAVNTACQTQKRPETIKKRRQRLKLETLRRPGPLNFPL